MSCDNKGKQYGMQNDRSGEENVFMVRKKV